ncbi:hypothetical protein VTK73DRAFT_9015 [Phialemonium thermophilum]|uniref:Uncharacterized protein n=1 Tax=Phialemonium thermophilum TaxID=223376 RepID=A0ABR3W536_9PEZI
MRTDPAFEGQLQNQRPTNEWSPPFGLSTVPCASRKRACVERARKRDSRPSGRFGRCLDKVTSTWTLVDSGRRYF